MMTPLVLREYTNDIEQEPAMRWTLAVIKWRLSKGRATVYYPTKNKYKSKGNQILP
jgi:hypothetical protein